MREEIYMLKDDLCDALAEQQKNGVTSGNIDVVYKLSVSAEKVAKLITLCEQQEYSRDGYSRDGGGYSSNGGGYSSGRYSRDGGGGSGNSYDGGSSYGRHYVRGHYSRDDGKQSMREKLERMMNNANSREERETIQKIMEQMERE